MTKFVLKALMLMALVLSASVHADVSSPITKGGGDFYNGSRVGLGNFPAAFSYLAIPFTAQAAITVGMPVMVNTDVTSYASAVSKTTSAGPIGQVGIATNTAAAGETVWVAIAGKVKARFPVSMTVTTGVFYTGTTNGDLTPTSTVTGSTQTSSVSIVQTVEAKVVNATDGLARCVIVR